MKNTEYRSQMKSLQKFMKKGYSELMKKEYYHQMKSIQKLLRRGYSEKQIYDILCCVNGYSKKLLKQQIATVKRVC